MEEENVEQGAGECVTGQKTSTRTDISLLPVSSGTQTDTRQKRDMITSSTLL